MDKALVVLSDNFGTSFSGGCTATANFVKFWKASFDTIYVVCKKTDDYLKGDVQICKYSDQNDLDDILAALSKKEVIGYGDFYTAEHFISHGIAFYFTYHDNYPELVELNTSTSQSTRMMESYAKIFQHAEFVFSVSEYKLEFIKKYTNNCALIRNGISQPQTKINILTLDESEPLRILMAGNFSKRKYEKAILLFEKIKEQKIGGIQIDVFGNSIDEGISNQLDGFSFVKKQMFQNTISYEAYNLYLNTSLVENLSLSVVDAIANTTPVVSFNVGGIAEVINESNGVIIPKYNIEAMLSAILEIKNQREFDFSNSQIIEFDWEMSASKMLRIMNQTTAIA